MPLNVWLYNNLKSTMLILDNPVGIILQNNFKYRKQNIIKVNSDVVTSGVVLPCMMLGGKEKRNCFFSVLSLSEGVADTGLQEEELINRLEVIF